MMSLYSERTAPVDCCIIITSVITVATAVDFLCFDLSGTGSCSSKPMALVQVTEYPYLLRPGRFLDARPRAISASLVIFILLLIAAVSNICVLFIKSNRTPDTTTRVSDC